ncbi:MAG: glycosyltransferase family 4 protein [Minisyncoccota bacterium]
MKIGFLVKTVNPKNGAGRYASDIIETLRSKGHQVLVFKEENDGLEGEVILNRGIKILNSVQVLKEKLKDCDVIHAIDGYPYGVIGWLVNIKLKKKLIISALGTYAVAPLYRWQTAFLLKKAYESAHRVIAISKFTKNKILEKLRLDNIVVINPGIKLSDENSKRIESQGRFIMGVGALKERKGYHIALEAFAKISKEFPDLRYVIVADPDRAYREILDNIVKRNNLEGRVDFLSFIQEEKLVELYSKATLFALTSINTADIHFEGFGIVYLEAAGFGLPVIGTFDTGGEDAINNGKNGILIHQNNVEETAEAMRKILSDKSLREQMSRESFEWSKKNSVEAEVGKILEIYNS